MRQTTATLQGKREEVIDSSGPSVTLLVAFGPSVRGGGRPSDAHWRIPILTVSAHDLWQLTATEWEETHHWMKAAQMSRGQTSERANEQTNNSKAALDVNNIPG